MFGYANPLKFLRLSDWLMPVLGVASLLLLAGGGYWGLVASPPDYQQGETVRIMYVHVPAAWMAMFCYSVIAVGSFISLIWRHVLAEIAAKSAAPLGAGFTALALITGSLWGKPMWGTWWVWDARLTSVLILFFLYLGYIALWEAIENRQAAARSAAILALVGFINVPIIKFSVDWWNTLHQPASVSRIGAPALHPAFLWPLLIVALGYTAFFFFLLLVRMRSEIFARRLEALQIDLAYRETTAQTRRGAGS